MVDGTSVDGCRDPIPERMGCNFHNDVCGAGVQMTRHFQPSYSMTFCRSGIISEPLVVS